MSTTKRIRIKRHTFCVKVRNIHGRAYTKTAIRRLLDPQRKGDLTIQ